MLDVDHVEEDVDYATLCLCQGRDGHDRALSMFLHFIRRAKSFHERQVLYLAYGRVREDVSSRFQWFNMSIVSSRHHVNMFLVLLVLMKIHTADVTVNCDVTLEDVYLRRIKRISVAVKRSTSVMKDVYISLADPAPTYRFEGHGDEAYGAIGDIVVNLRILDHPTHRIDNIISKYDLHTTVSVPFYDYLYGGKYNIVHLDGSLLPIVYPPQSAQRVVIFENIGLQHECGRGALYVFFDVTMPSISQDRLANPITQLFLLKLLT